LDKIGEARRILGALGLPPAQQNEIAALTLLALCGLGPDDPWPKAKRRSLTLTKGIMAFVEREYGKSYAPNTRETFRRQVLHQFIQACVVDYNPDEPKLPTNSPRTHYALSGKALGAIRKYRTKRWHAVVKQFMEQQGALLEVYRKKRSAREVPVRLPNGRPLTLSPGKHNKLQAAVIEQFAPRFAPGARLLYM